MKTMFIVFNAEDEFATKQMFFKLQEAVDYYKKMLKKNPTGKWKLTHKEVF